MRFDEKVFTDVIDTRNWFDDDGRLRIDQNEVRRLRRESDEIAKILTKAMMQ